MPRGLARIPILMYHRIEAPKPSSKLAGHCVEPGQFARQMRAMQRMGFEAVQPSAIHSPPNALPRKPFAITFDDGYASFAENALSTLVRHGFASTVFLVANHIGERSTWDADGGAGEPLMDGAQILDALSKGTTFGSHTLTHADLSRCDDAAAMREIRDSKGVLEGLTGTVLDCFAYPYGRFTSRTQELVREAGYGLACSTRKGVNTMETDRFALKRINVRRDTSLPVLIFKLYRGLLFDR